MFIAFVFLKSVRLQRSRMWLQYEYIAVRRSARVRSGDYYKHLVPPGPKAIFNTTTAFCDFAPFCGMICHHPNSFPRSWWFS